MDERKDGSAIQDYLKEKTGARSVPRTFISQFPFPVIILADHLKTIPGGESVGGNDDLQAKSKKEVDELITKRS